MNTVPQTIDVLIIGAGPTGLTLALDLARRGVSHRIIERSESYNTASRAKGIQSRSLEVIDDLKAVRYITDTGIVNMPIRYYTADGKTIDKPDITVAANDEYETPYPDMVWIAQFDVEKALRDRYADLGGHIEFGMEAIGYTQDLNGVTVDVNTRQEKQQIRACYVIGADGGSSTIRTISGIPFIGETYERKRLHFGDVRLEGLDRDHIHIWGASEGMIMVTPLPNTDIWQLQATIPEEVEKPEKPSLEVYQGMFDRRADIGRVRITDAPWTSIFRVNIRMVEQFHKGRVFLAGEAAHVHPPAGGQGMNTGIQDAYNLGWKLAAVLHGAKPSLLDTYDEERRPVAQAVLQDSFQKAELVLGTATDSGELFQSLNTLNDDLTSELGISYSSSSLTQLMSDENRMGPKPGDRAPDAKGLHGNHFDGNIFDLIRGPHWTVLVFTDKYGLSLPLKDSNDLHIHRISKSNVKNTDQLIDSKGNAYRIYNSIGNDMVLIRPDGYIAMRSNINDAKIMSDYLEQFIPDIGE